MPLRQLTAPVIQRIKAFELDPTGGPAGWGRSRPAFQVTFNDNTTLVLKAEFRAGTYAAAAHESVRWDGKMMKQVSPQAKAKLLDASERAVLLALPQGIFTPPLAQQYMQDLVQASNGQLFIFYKMPFVENLRSADSMLNQGKAAKLLAKLKTDRNALLQLGRIVAVDMFIGNEDRFDKRGAIANRGNIVFQKNADKTYTPVGLDFYDAQKDAASVYSTPAHDWSGLVLRDHNAMLQFSQAVIGSLNQMFTGSLPPPVSNAQLLPLLAAGTFKNGMAQGTNDLRTYLMAKHTAANQRRPAIVVGGARRPPPAVAKGLPPGVVRRMVLLGWTA